MRKIPNHIEESILTEIKNKLKPKVSTIALKLFSIHLATAILTLSICSQFGIKLFNLPIDLMRSLMVFGMPFCELFCGVFFTTTSITMASFFMGRDEIRFLRYNRFVTTFFIILTSIGFFYVMNPNIFFELSALWLLGALAGSLAMLEIQWNFKKA